MNRTSILEHKQIDAGNDRWRYFAAGAGERGLVIFPGSLGAAPSLVELFRQTLPHRRIVLPEYAPVSAVSDILQFTKGILDAERIKQTAILGGSFGGIPAQTFVRQNKEIVTHMILSGTGGPDRSRITNHRRAFKLIPFLPMPLLRAALRLLLYRMLRNTRVHREIFLSDYGQLITRLKREDIASRYEIAIDFDQSYNFSASDLQDWAGKILILEGDADRVASKKMREQLKNLYPVARIHTFAGAGHSVMMTQPQETLQIISEFLTQ
jgi:pimeloyl-ACP methyl ester carboxylesterase